MPLVSLCMIVRNEEKVLGRCLDSVADLVDEIVLVDTGSTDGTKAVAAQYEAKIYDMVWQDDFSAARNYAIEQCVGDYWMWLDADDVVEPDSRLKLRAILENPGADVVYLPYHLGCDEAGRPAMQFYRERIFCREKGYRFSGAVHEAVSPFGTIRYGDAAITHRKEAPGDPDRNLHIYQKKLLRGEPFSPREQYYYARELWEHGAYRAALPILEQFLQTGAGWKADQVGACLLCARCCEKLEQPEMALHYLLQSMRYDVPHPEICCAIGDHFFQRKAYQTAIFWYETARWTGQLPLEGFCVPAYGDIIPVLQLCVCYDRLGDIFTAAAYNEIAGRIQPHHRAVLHNRQYFTSKGIDVTSLQQQ